MKSFREFADENARENSATNGARVGCGAENNNAENNGAAEFASNGAAESAGTTPSRQSASPMLNFVQRKKLEQIVTQLKNI